jgi:hypothetical protein
MGNTVRSFSSLGTTEPQRQSGQEKLGDTLEKLGEEERLGDFLANRSEDDDIGSVETVREIREET